LLEFINPRGGSSIWKEVLQVWGQTTSGVSGKDPVGSLEQSPPESGDLQITLE